VYLLASLASVAMLVWIASLWVSLAREALSEPKSQDVQVVNASSLVVTPDIRLSWGKSSVTASYTFMIDGVQHSGTRVFPNRTDRLYMTAGSANELAAEILRDGKVRVPHGDAAQAFLAYRSAASWLFYMLGYPFAAIVVLVVAVLQVKIAHSKWAKAKTEADERRANVDKAVVKRDS